MTIIAPFIVYITIYIFVIAFLAFLAGHMFTKTVIKCPEDQNNSVARIYKSIGWMLITLCGLHFIYMPAYLLYLTYDMNYWFTLLFPINFILLMPCASHMFNALLQRKINNLHFDLFQLPNIILTALFALTGNNHVILIMLAYTTVLFVAYIIYYIKQYRHYTKVLESEYSNLEHRELKWIWAIMVSFVLQMALFTVCELSRSLFMSFFYMLFTVANAMFMVLYTRNILPVAHIDEDVMEDKVPVAETKQSNEKEKMVRDTELQMIEEQLKTHFEDQRLYTNPNLTRDMLCQTIGYNRNVLARYFRVKGVNYYKFVNGYRIRYACQLIDEGGTTISLLDIAKKCGYSTYRTFNSAFQEEVGVLPSEYKKR